MLAVATDVDLDADHRTHAAHLLEDPARLGIASGARFITLSNNYRVFFGADVGEAVYTPLASTISGQDISVDGDMQSLA